MDGLLTAGAIAVLLLGVHVLFAVYIYRVMSSKVDDGRDSSSAGAVDRLKAGPETSAAPANGSRSEQTAKEDRATVPCPTCGVPNDPSFQFCRDCVSELSAAGAPTMKGTD